MNLQETLAPIGDLFMWTFGLLEAGNDYVNWLLIIIISAALVYWIIRLLGFEKAEIVNR
ncbi:MAG: hypothetical protein ACI9UR_002713 [Bacteroidia bacterium]|jgi:hypothetical protein